MGDPVTQALFFERMDQMQRSFQDAHSRLRQDMTEGFEKMAGKLDQHSRDDLMVEKRVLVIETQRGEEQAQAVKRGAWAGLFTSAGLMMVWEIIKSSWKK